MPQDETQKSLTGFRLFRNWITLIGAVIAVSSIFAFLLLLFIEISAHLTSPYMGILEFVIAPGCFFAGLVLIVLGVVLQIRKHDTRVQIDLSRPHDRKLMAWFIAGAVVYLLLTAYGSYQTFQLTDSVQFCGVTCHEPMHPEFTAYLRSPHARVACVECHVGAGAEWYFRSKLNGIHQLYAVMTNTVSRPIETPVRNLRPAGETCEECHWPERFVGGLERINNHFLSDDANTPFTVRLLLKVGSGGANGAPHGIHWHVNHGEKVEYIATDPQRQVIPWVRVTDVATGKTTVYQDKSFKDDPAKHTIRTMDCIDCHSRPSHQFLAPNEAVDASITASRLDRSIPKLKFNVVTALTVAYKTTDEAIEKISASLHAAYPNQANIDAIVAETQQIYRDNFFPEMKTDWRTHPDNIGHKTWPGCFRCHDGDHKTADGKMISGDDCNKCHVILAQGSGDQLKQLKADGYEFYHIDSTYLDFSCANCHTGAIQK